MKLEGKAAEEKGMVLIDKYMNQCFGDDVWLSACHGPASMTDRRKAVSALMEMKEELE